MQASSALHLWSRQLVSWDVGPANGRHCSQKSTCIYRPSCLNLCRHHQHPSHSALTASTSCSGTVTSEASDQAQVDSPRRLSDKNRATRGAGWPSSGRVGASPTGRGTDKDRKALEPHKALSGPTAPAGAGCGGNVRMGVGGRPWTTLHVRLQQSLATSKLLEADSVLVAVSGGQDSVCLLRALVDLQPLWGWRLGVVHCDHGWRVDSAANADFVRAMAEQRLALPCYVRVAPPGSVPSERAAREWRYRVFADVAATQGFDVVVTGHTATDRAETMLLNLLRGSGPDGLVALARSRPLAPPSPTDLPASGQHVHGLTETIPNPNPAGSNSGIKEASSSSRSRSVRLVRPLLEFSRDETQDFVEHLGLQYFHDTTNDCNDLRRNRLRNEVLPALRQGFNPRLDQALYRFLEVLGAEIEYLAHVTDDLFDDVVSYSHRTVVSDSNGGYDGEVLKVGKLQRLPLAMQRRVVRKWLEGAMNERARRNCIRLGKDGGEARVGSESGRLSRAGVAHSRVRYEDVARCLALLYAPNNSNSDSLCGGIVASVRDGHLVLWTPGTAMAKLARNPSHKKQQQQQQQQ